MDATVNGAARLFSARNAGKAEQQFYEQPVEAELLPEYDFSFGIRGKYHFARMAYKIADPYRQLKFDHVTKLAAWHVFAPSGRLRDTAQTD